MADTRTILLVDDYPDALDVWEIFLRAEGFHVLTAGNGFQALTLATKNRPDVIVMDLDLPDISGFEVARELRSQEDTRNIPIIAATGHSHMAQHDKARNAGFDAVVVKPCDPDTLVGQIQRLLGANGARPAATIGH